MLAKILAGVLAAVVVSGVGIYYAGPDNSRPTCPGHKATTLEALPVSEGASCCMLPGPADTATSTEPANCCAAPAKTDSLAACVGGMPLTSAATVASPKAPFRCCDE